MSEPRFKVNDEVIAKDWLLVERSINGSPLDDMKIAPGTMGTVIKLVPAHTGLNESDVDAIAVNWAGGEQMWIAPELWELIAIAL
jgi:hypothetical protein